MNHRALCPRLVVIRAVEVVTTKAATTDLEDNGCSKFTTWWWKWFLTTLNVERSLFSLQTHLLDCLATICRVCGHIDALIPYRSILTSHVNTS